MHITNVNESVSSANDQGGADEPWLKDGVFYARVWVLGALFTVALHGVKNLMEAREALGFFRTPCGY